MRPADRVLVVLHDRPGAFVPRDELARECAVAAPQVTAAVKELAERGHGLEFSPTEGVRLTRPVRPDAVLIEPALEGRRLGRSVLCFDEVDSTNDVARDAAQRPDADGLVVLAESQRKGRGRLGRPWVSPAGANLLMSVVLRAEGGELTHEPLTIAAGLAVAEGLAAATGLRCHLKWPNDVLLDGAKLAGVLVEAPATSSGRAFVVGIGVNVNAAPPPAEIGRPAACLADRLGPGVERVPIAREILLALDDWLARIAAGRLDQLHHRWVARCGMIDQRATVRSGGASYVGRVLDVRPLEGLVLLCDDGTQVRLPAQGATVEA